MVLVVPCVTIIVPRLNEGHTVFLERKIISRLNGEQSRHFQAISECVI